MRSDTVKRGDARAPHRSPRRACGVDEKNFDKPFIAIVSSHVDVIPGHVHLNDTAQFVRNASLMPVEFHSFSTPSACAMELRWDTTDM